MHCADLPELLLGQRIVAHPALDPAARLALFHSCHALARLVLLHVPSSKRVTHRASSATRTGGQWSPKLERLFNAKWQPLPPRQLDLELRVEKGQNAPQLPPKPPPTSMTHHISHLHLHQLRITISHLAAWKLHNAILWPHLQHLTISHCTARKAGVTAPPLPPIPRLESFTWMKRTMQDLDVLLPLASNVTSLHMAVRPGEPQPPWMLDSLQHMPRLTHLRLDNAVTSAWLRALLRHPTLEHLAVGSLTYPQDDLSKQPCRWKTLAAARLTSLGDVAKLPVEGLERLTVALMLSRRSAYEGAGSSVAALQRLHRKGKLVLLPPPGDSLGCWWRRPNGVDVLGLSGAGASTYALRRLVAEAGQGVHAVAFAASALPLPLLREALAPAMQRQPGARVHTLCLHLNGSVTEQWCAGVLGTLPPCVTHVEVSAEGVEHQRLAALVRGGAEGLRHVVHLSVLQRGNMSAEQERELRHLLAVGGEGAGARQQQSATLLTLVVVDARQVWWWW